MAEHMTHSDDTNVETDVNHYETDARGFPLTDEFGRELDPLFYTKVNAKVAKDYRIDVGARYVGSALPLAEVGDGQL